MKDFYITTTIPYVNAPPHLGFALELVQADTLARHQKALDKKVFFNTGTDEHGLKIFQAAKKQNKHPQKYVNEYAAKFGRLGPALNLSYNNFIRTTDPHHCRAAREFWRRCQKNGDIYQAKQKIKYCVGCEMEKTDSELVKDRCPLHPNKKLIFLKEKNYFFRFSRYQKRLLQLYEENPDFIIPRHRLKEIKNFVGRGLRDFSISRLKKKLSWGIEVPGDKNQVMYVWFDALINYISALGWPQDKKKFQRWWPGIQVAGKDNLRQQTAIWQAMLMSAGLPNTRQVLIHGFITANGRKMSKSLGNVINPFALVKKYGTDPLRYYLLKEIPPTKDGDFTEKHFQEVYNADLANGLGNLIQRVAVLCQNLPPNLIIGMRSHLSYKIFLNKKKRKKYRYFLENYQFNRALAWIWKKAASLDKYINQVKPWEKKGKELEEVLTKPIKEILTISLLLKPFLPETSKKIKLIFEDKKVKAPTKPLFPRVK